jgi:hypothetical protein
MAATVESAGKLFGEAMILQSGYSIFLQTFQTISKKGRVQIFIFLLITLP